MVRRLLSTLVVTFLVLAACSVNASPGASPKITRVKIQKSAHTMQLFAGDRVVKTYSVALGPGGAGPKKREGDKVTPVGRYHVLQHAPSQYRVFLRLDYPNAEDRARFERLRRSGELPRGATIGGDIGIHGPPVSLPDEDKHGLKAYDWTLGCIALDDDEIKEVSRLVPDGTVIDIED